MSRETKSVTCFQGALRFAVQHDLLVRNPAESLRIPPDKRGKKRNKPYLTPMQFEQLVELIPEPYASMVYVAIYTGYGSANWRACAGTISGPTQSRSMNGFAAAIGVHRRVKLPTRRLE
jgi:hypothetical protein